MNLKELRYIITIADERSITKASQKLFISQPSLSQFVSDYEKGLGFSIFNRNRTGIEPTEAGKEFISMARAVVYSYDQTIFSIISNIDPSKRTIRIGMPFHRATLIVPYLMNALKARLPEINFEIIDDFNPKLQTQLLEDQIDVWVSAVPPFMKLDSSIKIQFVAKEEVVVAMPKNHPLIEKLKTTARNKRKYIPIKELDNQKFVICKNSHHLSQFSQGFFNQQHLNVTILQQNSSLQTSLNVAKETCTLMILTRGFKTLSDDFEYVSIGKEGTYWDIVLMYHEYNDNKVLDSLSEIFMEYYLNPSKYIQNPY